MIINKVSINNFFCFVGENILTFEKGLNIISAPNTSGKSQLFNAFFWTFFNNVYTNTAFDTQKKWRDANLIDYLGPDCLKHETNLGDEIVTSVSINITAQYFKNTHLKQDLVEYVFEKKIVYEKSSNDTLVVKNLPKLTIYYVKDGQTEYVPEINHADFLEELFPQSIRKFMWYQGETVDELYDFSRPQTLKGAIDYISYYPYYDSLFKTVSASSRSIHAKISKIISKNTKLNDSQKKAAKNFEYYSKRISDTKDDIKKIGEEIAGLNDNISEVKLKAQGLERFQKLKEELLKLDAGLENIENSMENLHSFSRETLIKKWMLKGCEKIIENSEKQLNKINDIIKTFQNTKNPVPMSLPGPEYIDKMLVAGVCYICERPFDKDNPSDPAYLAIKKRINDYEENNVYKLLEEDFIQLNKSKQRLLMEIPEIENEIKSHEAKLSELFTRKAELSKQKRRLLDGGDDPNVINRNGGLINEYLQKLDSLNYNIDSKKRLIETHNRNLKSYNEELTKAKNQMKDPSNEQHKLIPEEIAGGYIEMFELAISKLNKIAYDKLIKEIQEESNKLYSSYFGGKPQGRIVIDKDGIKTIDNKTEEVLLNLPTSDEVVRKLAIANSFLSLSAKKLHRSYPVIADAPTSDFDAENTKNLTLNLSKSFDQIIIMSKDYQALDETERTELIKKANIVKYYEFKNDLIDLNLGDTRTNKKTFITRIK